MVGAHETVAGIDGGPFHDRQNVALDAFAADIGAVPAFAPGDLIDLVQEDDAAGLHSLQRHARHLVHVDELLLFFLHQVIGRFRHPHLAAARLAAEEIGEHVLQIDAHLFDARVGGDFEVGAAVFHFQFHDALVELALAQPLAQFLARTVDAFAGLRLRRHQQIEQALFGVGLGAVGHFFQALLAHHVDGDIHQVADHRFHVAAHVADFGELAGLHLQKRRIRQPRQPPRDFGLADARGADHEDVLRHHLVGHFGRQFLAADAVAQRDGHGALGFGLSDYVLIQFAHDFARGELVEDRFLVRPIGAGR